jgi:hypothetical protein
MPERPADSRRFHSMRTLKAPSRIIGRRSYQLRRRWAAHFEDLDDERDDIEFSAAGGDVQEKSDQTNKG